MKSRLLRSGALAAAAGLALLPAVAQSADSVVASADATALELSIAGNGFDTGTTTATNNGNKQTKTGEVQPPISVLKNQGLLNVGALVQDAETAVTNRKGSSEACSGVAGNGAGVGSVGDSNCITPGDPVGISIANLDLTGAVVIDPASALSPLAALNPILSQILTPLTSTISDALAPLGATGLGGSLGAVESRCSADLAGASGTANIVDTTLGLDVAGTSIDLVQLPVNPPPNTKVLTDLDAVLNAVIDGLRVDLENTLDGLAAPLTAIIDPIQDQVVNLLIAQIAPQLAPLEDNILDITLNKQTTSNGGKAIEVTAISLKLLPAASAFGFDSLVGAEIATVSCGPSARVAPSPSPTPSPTPTPDPDPSPTPEVPTVVDAGAFGPVSSDGGPGSPLLWGLVGVTLASGAGAVAGRRLLRR
jgi:hypothetical protein